MSYIFRGVNFSCSNCTHYSGCCETGDDVCSEFIPEEKNENDFENKMLECYNKHKVMGDYDFEINEAIFNEDIKKLLSQEKD